MSPHRARSPIDNPKRTRRAPAADPQAPRPDPGSRQEQRRRGRCPRGKHLVGAANPAPGPAHSANSRRPASSHIEPECSQTRCGRNRTKSVDPEPSAECPLSPSRAANPSPKSWRSCTPDEPSTAETWPEIGSRRSTPGAADVRSVADSSPSRSPPTRRSSVAQPITRSLRSRSNRFEKGETLGERPAEHPSGGIRGGRGSDSRLSRSRRPCRSIRSLDTLIEEVRNGGMSPPRSAPSPT